MSKKALPGSPELGQAIRDRREELDLTIEAAAAKAGIGVKSWCRYEAGGNISPDKARSLCSVLRWVGLPSFGDENSESDDPYEDIPPLEFKKENLIWSDWLEDNFGVPMAVAFGAGSDYAVDEIDSALQQLASKPKGTHIGEICSLFIESDLPEEFLTSYDYTFVYNLRCSALKLRVGIKQLDEFKIETLMDAVALMVIFYRFYSVINMGEYVVYDKKGLIYDARTDEYLISDYEQDMDRLFEQLVPGFIYVLDSLRVHTKPILPESHFHISHWNEPIDQDALLYESSDLEEDEADDDLVEYIRNYTQEPPDPEEAEKNKAIIHELLQSCLQEHSEQEE